MIISGHSAYCATPPLIMEKLSEEINFLSLNGYQNFGILSENNTTIYKFHLQYIVCQMMILAQT